MSPYIRASQVLVRVYRRKFFLSIPEDMFIDVGPTLFALLLKLETVATDIIRPARYGHATMRLRLLK